MIVYVIIKPDNELIGVYTKRSKAWQKIEDLNLLATWDIEPIECLVDD